VMKSTGGKANPKEQIVNWNRCTRAGGSRPHPPALPPVRT